MRKKLVFLVFALAAIVAASITGPASALKCPANFHVVVCGADSFCCHNGMVCNC